MLWRQHLRWFESRYWTWVCLIGVSCAGTSFNGHVYQDDDVRFRVGEIPTGWRRIELEGALLAFRDDAANASVALNGRCKVDGDDVPLSALTQHLFLQFTDRTQLSQSAVSLDGREALRTEISAALDGVKKRYLVYVLKKNGCVYDFMYVAEAPAASASASFERFVQGFATLD